jgi:hypothetical protein
MEPSAINGILDETWLNKLDASDLMLNFYHRKKNLSTFSFLLE